jgi:chemotaxis protein histidine kinase CheA
VDRVLDDVFQLISLFFMTIGRNNEAPAAYALLSTIKRLLHHLTEVDLYSAKDLEHLAHTFENLRTNVKNAESSYHPKLITLLTNRLNVCQALLDNLVNKLGRLAPELADTHEKLISILRSISLANTRAKVSVTGICRDQIANKSIQVLKLGSSKAASSVEGNRRYKSRWKVCHSEWRSSSRQPSSL